MFKKIRMAVKTELFDELIQSSAELIGLRLPNETKLLISSTHVIIATVLTDKCENRIYLSFIIIDLHSLKFCLLVNDYFINWLAIC